MVVKNEMNLANAINYMDLKRSMDTDKAQQTQHADTWFLKKLGCHTCGVSMSRISYVRLVNMSVLLDMDPWQSIVLEKRKKKEKEKRDSRAL